MIRLTNEDAEKIQCLLYELRDIEDNSRYHMYSKEGLQARLDDIMDAICCLDREE